MKRPVPRGEDLLGGAALLLFLLLPAVVEEWRLAEFAIYFTYGLFAVSLAFVWGHCGLLCFGQAAFFGIGAYGMSLATLGMLPGLSWLTASWAGLLFGVGAAAGFARLLGHFLFSAPRLRGPFFGIVTLAVAFLLERLAVNWSYVGGLNGLVNVPPLGLGLAGPGFEIWETLPVYYLQLGFLALVTFLMLRFLRSPAGVLLAAIRDNETRSRALGCDVVREKIRAFTLGGAVAGLAGALFVTQFGFASPSLIGFSLSAEVLIWVAVGGRGSPVAAALGAVFLRWIESGWSSLLGDWWLLALGALFVLVVMALPHGLAGEAIRALDRLTDRLRRG